MNFQSSLTVRNMKIDPPLILAPMVGLSHSALRSLILEIGGIGLLFTEMLSAKRLPEENENISPCLIRTSEEFPLFYQLFLSDETLVAPAIEKLHEIGAQGVDVNLGCPAPKLRKRGAGCALSKDRPTVKKILAAFRKNTDLPLSVKIRLGDSLVDNNYLDLCRLIEGEGADLLIIHARLNGEKFCRKPRWDWIAKAKNEVTLPVIANGGIFTVDDAARCLKISGADGLMIGRGAAVRPWIFADIAANLYKTDTREELCMLDVYNRFSELLTIRFPLERRLGRLKQFTHYFAESYHFGHHLASAVQNSTTMEQAVACANQFFQTHEPLNV